MGIDSRGSKKTESSSDLACRVAFDPGTWMWCLRTSTAVTLPHERNTGRLNDKCKRDFTLIPPALGQRIETPSLPSSGYQNLQCTRTTLGSPSVPMSDPIPFHTNSQQPSGLSLVVSCFIVRNPRLQPPPQPTHKQHNLCSSSLSVIRGRLAKKRPVPMQ